MCIDLSKLLLFVETSNFGSVQGDLSWVLGSSNHISWWGVHSFLTSVETNAERRFQSNIYLEENFDVKMPYIYLFSLAACTMKCLSVLSSITVKNSKHTIIYIIHTLCISHFMWLIFLTVLIFVQIDSFDLKILFYFKKLFTFYSSLYFFLPSSKPTFIQHCYSHLFNTVTL